VLFVTVLRYLLVCSIGVGSETCVVCYCIEIPVGP